ncbi:SDR family NAD(P)-dependent oxidoreductase [Jiangella ureilytica]|uniref:SDR family NAD(P)-dependent oxidoreductase n=1 Tax=Jiangella ureilytica TaxID=2530374 RepID=A0A4R4RDV2_9ACTN|nr:SDR family NAD(P)-dependent oxidoreductase [Jiangella ureilytica]TDC47491.1 SDR family NAD(P)-dependent oxidoreductase [Jiangella ureilytica]
MNDTTIALVTGANKGIGKETARQLAALGHTVLLGSRDLERGRAAARELDGDVRVLALDVTDDSSVAAAAAVVADQFGRLDVLVNNAGIALGWAVPSATSLDDVRGTYAVNVFGLVAVTNAMLPLLRRSAAGRIVNVSSDLGSLTRQQDPASPYYGQLPLVAYSSSKTAVNGITVAYAQELAAAGITVNAVNPGYCATDLNGHSGQLSAAEGARVVVRAAQVAADGPTGAFFTDGGTLPW